MKVCFIGSGSIGKRHLKNFNTIMKNRNIDTNIHILRQTKNKLEDEFKEICDLEVFEIDKLDDFYDIIFINNPTHMHFETLKKLNNRANCFFIEKPLFHTNNIKIEELNLSKNKKYYVACPLRYSEVLKQAKEIIKNLKIYSIRAISSSYLPEWRKGKDYRDSYSAHKEFGGGVCLDLIHEWDYLLDMFGEPLEVKSIIGKFSNLEINSEDIAIYIAKYKDKLLELHLDYFGREEKRELEIYSERETWKFDILKEKIYINGILSNSFNEDPNEKYVKEMNEFLQICINGKENKNDIMKALISTKIST